MMRIGLVLRLSIMAAALAVAGCGGSGSSSSSGGGGSAATGYPLAAGGAKTVYTVNSGSSTGGTNQVLRFTAGASGTMTPLATLTAPANFVAQAVAVDSAGLIYLGGSLAGAPEVVVYAAGGTGSATPMRTLQVFIGAYYDPIESLSLDAAGNLYVVGFQGTIAVYPAGASGTAAPARSIAGTLTGLSNAQAYGVAIDATGNLYVSTANSNLTGGAVLEFGPTANGNVAPIRTITTPTLIFFGIAVDTTGNVYVAEDNLSATAPATIAEFGPTASGAAAPLKTITLTGTTASVIGGLRLDTAGNLYAVLGTMLGTGASATSSFSVVAVGPGATGTIAPTDQMTSAAWSAGAASELALGY